MPLKEHELFEIMLGARSGALQPGATIRRLLEPPPSVLPRVGSESGSGGGAEPVSSLAEACHKPVWARQQQTTLPPDELLDAACLHGRGLGPRRIALAALSRELDIDANCIAEGLNRAELMVSLPVADVPPDIDDWCAIYQLAAALGASSLEARMRATAGYAGSDMWDWAHLPLDARADDLLAWLAGEFVGADPKTAARMMTTLVNSPEAFRVTAGRVLRVFDQIDGGVFAALVQVLARFRCYARLAREDPARRLVQEIVRHAAEHSGDSTLAAAGLELLVGDQFGNPVAPGPRDLALAATVATFVTTGRPGWRNPMLRPALVEAALHGAPGCRRAALLLAAE